MSYTPSRPIRFVALVFAASLPLLALLYAAVGGWAAMLSVVPIIILGSAFGQVAGTVSALAFIVINILLVRLDSSFATADFPAFQFWVSQVLLVVIGAFGGRFGDSRRDLEDEITRRQKVESSLRAALFEIKQLKGTMAICSACKHIRDDEGEWVAVEYFIAERSDASFTHGICPPCADALYPE